MKRLLATALFVTLPLTAWAEPVIVQNDAPVPETVERLKASVEAAGGRVFSVIDFGGAIRSVNEDVGDVQLVIFGNPRIGAAALSADRMAALDLPGKVLVYDTGDGSAMAYEQPTEMLAEWNIPADAPVLDMMSRTLHTVTSAATE